MITFSARIKRFGRQGEKTGWSFIEISKTLAEKMKPGVRVSYRVKGSFDQLKIEKVSLVPMGEGKFIIPVNGTMRKKLGKHEGDLLKVSLESDDRKFTLSPDLVACLKDEPRAWTAFNKLPGSHQRYFSKWVDSAKTVATKTKRITMAVMALSEQKGYAEMIRENKKRQ